MSCKKSFENFVNIFSLCLLNPVSIRNFKSSHKFIFVVLNLIYFPFSLILQYYILCDISLYGTDVLVVVVAIQSTFPTFIAIIYSFDYLKIRRIKSLVKVSNQVKNDVKYHRLWLNVLWKMLIIFSMLIIQAFVQPDNNSFVHISSIFLPFSIISMSDFMFNFYISYFVLKLKKMNEKYKTSEKMSSKYFREFESSFDEWLKNIKKLEKFYSCRVFLSITLNIVLLIIALYWIFIRTLYNRLNFKTFTFLIPPIMSFHSIFSASNAIRNEIKKTNKIAMEKYKDNEKLSYNFSRFLRHQFYHKSEIIVMQMIPLNSSTIQRVSFLLF